jgi:ATP-dependent protease ClpP protease subunit
MKTYIYYHGAVNIQGIRNLETLLTDEACKEDPSEITLCLCSGGGDVCAGIGAYNFIRMLPVQISIHNFGICGSIAATMFLAGGRRTAASSSIFTLHAASYVNGPRAGQVSEDTQLICHPFSTVLGWEPNRIEEYFGSPLEQYISAQNAIGMSLVEEISDFRIAPHDKVIHVKIP